MSSLAFLMEQVQVAADKKQPELLRRVLDTYTVNPIVCAYQAHRAKLHKLKLELQKADDYLVYLRERISWTGDVLANGRLESSRELVLKKHRQFMDEEKRVAQRLVVLAEMVSRVELLFGQTQPCGQCRACLCSLKRNGVLHGQ